MKITVVGARYQGLVVGSCLAESGHHVTLVDRKPEVIASLTRGELPVYEPGLEELVVRNLEEERLTFTTDLEDAVAGCLVVFLCVATPCTYDGECDLTNIDNAVRQIAEAMTDYCIVVNKTTCPPGTGDHLYELMRSATEHPCDLVVNPDFQKEGSAVDDFMRPDRVVIGCEDVRVREILKELYSPYLRTGRPFLVTDRRSAEMTKYATNVILASRISVMNQLADLCKAYDANIADVREALSADERIGPTFLFPGLGYGGFGLPKDLATLVRMAAERGVEADLIEAIVHVNDRRRERFLQRILQHYGDTIAVKKIALWGASFKPRTDDVRGAPAVYLIDGLLEAGASIVVYDPAAGPRLRARYGDRIQTAAKSYHALEGADGLIIATEWNEFRRPDYDRMGELMGEKVIFDGRNLYTPSVMKKAGFQYISVGRPEV
jgi:UDPglucose 6-dehydrogenase